jgi:hypothetical protein
MHRIDRPGIIQNFPARSRILQEDAKKLRPISLVVVRANYHLDPQRLRSRLHDRDGLRMT